VNISQPKLRNKKFDDNNNNNNNNNYNARATATEQVRSRGNACKMCSEDGIGFETQPGIIWLRRQTSSIVL